LNDLNGAKRLNVLNAVVLTTDFEPLPFEEAIDYFRAKTDVTAFQFRQMTALAQQKAFSIAGAATRQARLSIRGIIEDALTEGVTLGEFQKRAGEVMDAAGLSARTPWYWETVYRTNLQTSYQVGRWKQMTTPAVRAARPYLRYVSALLPTTRPSHREKHGLTYPVDHEFWNEWYPPNGFNCYCTVTSVSESLLERRGWKVSEQTDFAFPDADQGFQINAGRADEI
jgi:SPP1 gp7 family putative phage head morphogenesis protein